MKVVVDSNSSKPAWAHPAALADALGLSYIPTSVEAWQKKVVVFANTQGADKLHLNDFLGNFWRCSYILIVFRTLTTKVGTQPPCSQFSSGTPHHWVLFDDSHHSALPATTDIVECLGHQHHKLHCPGNRAGNKRFHLQTMKAWISMEGLLGVHWRYPNIFQPEVDEGTHLPGSRSPVFLGHVYSCRSKICKQLALAICQDSLEFCLMVDHDKFHKIMPSCSKYRKYHSRLTFSYHSKNCCMRLLGVAVWFDFLC